MSSSSLTPIRSPIREIPSTISEELGSVRSSLHEQEEHTSSKIMEEEVGGKCLCHLTKFEEIGEEEERIDPFAAREKELRKEFELHLDDEIMRMKTRFDLILQNEQVRTSCLLREAYRERQERISSLRNQLECKNLATLMFLLCSERRKKRHEIMEIIEEYTKHLKGLTDMICEGQFIMEDMIRGYKTAEKVDEEWRSKTKRLVHEVLKIMSSSEKKPLEQLSTPQEDGAESAGDPDGTAERLADGLPADEAPLVGNNQFQLFTEHYFGSNPESSKFFFNLPELLKICAPIEPCPCVDVTNSEASNPSEEGETDPEAATWWYKLQSSEKPFVVFGDMADFHPQKRRQLLKYLKENKENAPEKWKEYAFNNKFLEADCPNVDAVRQKYTKHSPGNTISCEYAKFMQSDNQLNGDVVTYKTAASSMEYGCLHMGSILRLVHQASSYPAQRIVNKASILGAKDSLELMSSSKLIEKKEKRKVDLASETKSSLISDELYSLNLHYTRKKRRTSIAPGVESRTAKEYEESQQTIDDDTSDTEDITSVMSKLASVHQDSLTILSTRSPNHSQGDRIRYEKECPVKACERKYVNSLLRNLPPYMDIRNPYTEYDRTFDSYEPCTQEELEKVVSLKPTTDRMSLGRERMKRDSFSLDVLEGLVRQRETGVAVQTEQVDDCTCHLVPSCQCSALLSQLGSEAPPPSPEMCLKKQNAISSSQLYNDTIQFDRFKVIGENFQHLAEKPKEFETHRVESIMRILQNHPSLYSMFQASAPIG